MEVRRSTLICIKNRLCLIVSISAFCWENTLHRSCKIIYFLNFSNIAASIRKIYISRL